MKPPPFEYTAPTTIAQAVDLLGDRDIESKVLAGGQSLVPLLSMRLARPQRLIDINTIPELAGVSRRGDRVRFGAMTRQRDLIDQDDHPLVAHAAAWIGHAAIRSRGTFGGSIAHADPSAELPSVAVACDATVDVASKTNVASKANVTSKISVASKTNVASKANVTSKTDVTSKANVTSKTDLTSKTGVDRRTVRAADLFEAALQTTLDDSELLTEVDLAVPARWGFAEMARRHGDFALVLAVVTQLSEGWRVVIGGVDSTPWRCAEAEVLLDNGATAASLADAVAETAPAFDDIHAPTDYRRAMAAHHVVQAATQALETPP